MPIWNLNWNVAGRIIGSNKSRRTRDEGEMEIIITTFVSLILLHFVSLIFELNKNKKKTSKILQNFDKSVTQKLARKSDLELEID